MVEMLSSDINICQITVDIVPLWLITSEFNKAGLESEFAQFFSRSDNHQIQTPCKGTHQEGS